MVAVCTSGVSTTTRFPGEVPPFWPVIVVKVVNVVVTVPVHGKVVVTTGTGHG